MTEIDSNPKSNTEERKRCCENLRFEDINEGKGYNALGIGRGTIVMSNIFLSTSLLRLASLEAGCQFFDEDDTIETPDCTTKIYGFRPSSLITNIAIISGLMAAFTMPLVGALIDFTPHRRKVGIISAMLMLVIQAIQIGTVQSTWFPMAMLQAIAAFIYQVQVLATYAYLPDLASKVGQSSMTKFTSIFLITQFASGLVFLLLISIVAMVLGMSDVTTAQMSQAVNFVWVSIAFGFGWNYLPNVGSLQKIPEKRSIYSAGFVKLASSAIGIKKYYGGSVGFFFLAIVFAEAGFNAFTSVSVTYLAEVVKMTGGEIGIVFAIVYIASFPGSLLGAFVTGKTNPLLSWKLCITIFSLLTIVGGFVLTGPESKILTYIWSALWGIGLGWFYPTENLIFSMCLPKGQEAGLTGFYVYCTQVLVWLPPLIFTTINEAGVHMKYALMSLVIFLAIAVIFIQAMDSWDTVLEKAATNKMIEDAYDENEKQEEAI